jgi:ubiquinone/menaquinone biosynthesis C-methylase UbiE
MHSSPRQRHRHSASPTASAPTTKGLVLNDGWRYDLMGWFHDIFSFRGKLRALRQKTISLAHLQPGEQVLDVGCGTGTLALDAATRVAPGGRVVGVDPGSQQIARARAKAARHPERNVAIEFQLGVIEQLPFPEQTFDVVFSTLMLHHLPTPLKRQGLTEIARVLKPGGRLIIADFTHPQERARPSARFRAGGSRIHEVEELLQDAGFDRLDTEEMPPTRFSTFPGARIVRAFKR